MEDSGFETQLILTVTRLPSEAANASVARNPCDVPFRSHVSDSFAASRPTDATHYFGAASGRRVVMSVKLFRIS